MTDFDPSTEQLAMFGALVWDKFMGRPHFFEVEESEDFMCMAEQCGMAHQANYDPDIHGMVDDAEPGDRIWVFGPKLPSAGEDLPDSTAEEGSLVAFIAGALAEADSPNRFYEDDVRLCLNAMADWLEQNHASAAPEAIAIFSSFLRSESSR
jgi:hypothetical protein